MDWKSLTPGGNGDRLKRSRNRTFRAKAAWFAAVVAFVLVVSSGVAAAVGAHPAAALRVVAGQARHHTTRAVSVTSTPTQSVLQHARSVVLGRSGPFTNLAGRSPFNTLFATGVGVNAGFEDNDGNLANDGTMDWNDFASPTPLTWSSDGTASTTSGPWTFSGLADAVGTNDSPYKSGTKQADECPVTLLGSANNKSDLARIYIAGKVDPALPHHVFLMLAWVRAPQ